MRVPKDISLSAYIKHLIKIKKIEQFYFSDDWKELRAEVMEDYHYECQECLKVGTYTKADCVHHINEVRVRPELALSKYFFDDTGQLQPNLIPLCNTCHNVIHDKLTQFKYKDKFTNKERW